jgi:hypothetical protein
MTTLDASPSTATTSSSAGIVCFSLFQAVGVPPLGTRRIHSAPDEPTRRRLLSRVVELYADKLHEPERALPFVEQLLVIDPNHEEARKVVYGKLPPAAPGAPAELPAAYEKAADPVIKLQLERAGARLAALLNALQ